MTRPCDTLVLSCMDFRLVGALPEWLRSQELIGYCDLVALAGGGARSLASPRKGGDREFVLEQIRIANHLRPKREVILINHQDCGGYGGRGVFPSETAEFQFHQQELRRAAEEVLRRFPHVEVRLVFARIQDGHVAFESVGPLAGSVQVRARP